MTPVAASGFAFVSWWQSCCVRGRKTFGRGSSVCIVTGLRPWRYGVRIPAGTRDPPLLHIAHASSEVHLASYSIVLGLLPGGDKAAGTW